MNALGFDQAEGKALESGDVSRARAFAAAVFIIVPMQGLIQVGGKNKDFFHWFGLDKITLAATRFSLTSHHP